MAKGTVDLGGNVDIANTSGDSEATTIWSGGDVILSGSATTTTDGSTASDKNALNGDVVDNDSDLSTLTSEAFFQKFFGATTSYVKANLVTQLHTNSGTTNYSNDLDGALGEFVWIEQTGGEAVADSTTVLNGKITIGSPERPVILVVEGNLKINGTATLYGILYVAQNWINNGSGTMNIYGAAIVDGDLQATGTPNTYYDEYVLGNVQKTLGLYVKLPGSWDDI